MWDIKYNLQRLHVNCTKDFISPEGNRKIKSAENSGNLSTHICHGVAYNVVQSRTIRHGHYMVKTVSKIVTVYVDLFSLFSEIFICKCNGNEISTIAINKICLGKHQVRGT